MFVGRFNRNASTRASRADVKAAELSSQLEADNAIIDSWPQPMDAARSLGYCKTYVEATTLTPREPCVSCGRAYFSAELRSSYSFGFHDKALPSDHPLKLFQYPDNRRYLEQSHVVLPQFLTNHFLYHQYLVMDQVTQRTTLRFCDDCHSSIRLAKVPKFSLCNNLYRGVLPEDLRDITWIEEKVCSLHRVTADVARLQNAEIDEKLPYRLVGNTCAHPVNVPSTARVLPRTPADINDSLTVVFVGPTFDKIQLPPMFRVRRKVIARFLSFLAANNPLYASVPISDCNLALYPDDGVLPLLEDSVILNNSSHLSNILAQETASLEVHPLNINVTSDGRLEQNPMHETTDVNSDAIIESTGVIDFKGNTISGHSATATALFNLLHPRKPGDEADLIIPRGASFVNDYDNPELFPGMFPTLFPYGTGGIEAVRTVPISFQQHVNYLLSLHENGFQYHRLFLFVALSIIKKRKGHLHTAFTVKRTGFQATAEVLSSISAETLESTARHLQAERPLSELSPEQKNAFTCLKQLNIVSAHIPGSPASKIYDRSAIRGYFGLFGLPHIFLTMNPATAHSPVLQVFFGDKMVDLSQRYPSMPIPDVRAKRIAKDPVAAADFFVFCIKSFLKHLLGYDTDTGKSTGGLLGHVKCYYGKCECTMRGCLHGHFVIWLLGGLNPREVHYKLEHDLEFQQRFFEFWEQVIKHDAPGDDIDISTASPEPRIQRPPNIDDPHWDSTFTYDVKLCAETLQRHKCQDVCWKYANVSHIPRELRTCRFHFPHEIVPNSYYDTKAKSIVMSCRDPTLNYYNPYILAFCRHNHDIKNILSGKSAKAAMFYITNYITKDDLHSHQILSMMSSAIAHVKEDSSASPVDRARARLHRWVSHLARLQEVHAQMAVLYIRGFGDTIASHATVPMLSRVLLVALKTLYPDLSVVHEEKDNTNSGNYPEESDNEETTILVRRSPNGSIFTNANQVDDYIHRDDQLSHLSFYEFVCCVRKEKGKLTTSRRLGSFAQFSLHSPHPQSQSHFLVMHQDPSLPLHRWKMAPRVIGMQVPRKESGEYALFMLGHFVPFSQGKPLLSEDVTPDTAFSSYQFPTFAVTIMQNWDDVHECEDERDAERMRRGQNASMASVHLNAKLAAFARGEGGGDDDDDGPLVVLKPGNAASSSAVEQMVHTLRSAGWFETSSVKHPFPDLGLSASISIPSAKQVKDWMKTLKEQEQDVRHERLNRGNSANQLSYSTTLMSQMAPPSFLGSSTLPSYRPASPCSTDLPETIATAKHPGETSEDIIRRIGQSMTLNEQQWISYLIVARKFVADAASAATNEPPSPPLRLLLTGPGGTGKSYVVNALNKLMGEYGMTHKLRIVAPTGSAAELVDATTIHKGLGILVKRKKDMMGSNGIGFVAAISKERRLALEIEWRPVEWLFCDECSLLGCPLNGELDQMLRLIKGNNTWYGGVNMVLAGDFSQYPPVQQSPLYEPITASTGSKTNSDFMKRVGRLAWLSINAVVELEEQKRMIKDPEYGHTVARLRMRRCTEADLALFNSRVVTSRDHPDGVELTPDESRSATTIVRDNKSRLYLNILKSQVLIPQEELVLCAARDFRKGGAPLNGEEQEMHLLADFASTISSGGLPSFIPLAVGMNVVLRTKNISPELKIANGSKGVLVALFTSANGPYQSADGAIVRFPASQVHLPTLPKGCIYVVPESKSYTVMVGDVRTSFRREQLLIEPAYVVTGHFSQGKTIPVVVADLKHGGPAAYVAASRPTCRNGLFLLQKLVLKDLNYPPPPPSLLRELDRLELLKHNTLVDYGFLQASKKPVFCDADEEKELVRFRGQALEWDTQAPGGRKRKSYEGSLDDATSSPKRRRVSINAHPSVAKTPPVTSSKASKQPVSSKRPLSLLKATLTTKRIPRVNSSVNNRPPVAVPYPLPFLKWDGNNYSCAYDTLLTPLYAAWVSLSPTARNHLRETSRYMQLLDRGFSEMQHGLEGIRTRLLHVLRERMRDLLSQQDAVSFPRSGLHLIVLDDIFSAIGLNRRLRFEGKIMCQPCGTVLTNSEITAVDLHYIFYSGSTDCLGTPVPAVVDVQRWISAQLETTLRPAHQLCLRCQHPLTILYTLQGVWPTILVFNPNPVTNTCLLPSLSLSFPGGGHPTNYRLSAIMYAGNAHFTARVRIGLRWWDYDGMQPKPKPFLIEGTVNHQALQRKLAKREKGTPTHYLYVISTDALTLSGTAV